MNDSPQTTEAAPTQAVTAQAAPQTRLDKVLALVPRALSSHVHIIFLACLGVFLVLLPLFGVNVSARAELIGGNYTNVTSDLGACIAAGLTVHLVRRDRRRSAELEGLFRSGHEALNREIQRAVAAAERAEVAAGGNGPGEGR
jgi:hypothetical protein